MATVEEEGVRGEKWILTQVGSLDLEDRPCVRSNGGRWTACSFIVGYEVFERMAFYGIGSNLVMYLTKKLHEGTVSSANNVTNWAGTVWMTPILGAYVADAHLGRYWTFVIASAIYLLGMGLLTLTVSLPSLRPPPCSGGHAGDGCDTPASAFQVGIFYCALYTIAVGAGGTKPNISTMGADQFDENDPRERAQKLSFFNWWMFSIFFGSLFAFTVVVYIQDNVGWALGYSLPTAGLAVSILVFLLGTPFYRHKPPVGSPFTTMARVLVAATRKWAVPLPADPKELYELDLEVYAKDGKSRIDHSTSLRFLDKAAVKSGGGTPWPLCPVTQVEETKQMIKMLPVLAAMFMPSMMGAQVQTLFIKQGTTLDRSMGPHFNVPPASLPAFVTLFMLASLVVYDLCLVPAARRWTGNPRGITLLQRMGVGLALHVLVMATASMTESRRLGVVRKNGITDAKAVVPLSIFTLLPQFALMGVAETFLEVAKLEFFYDQAPEGMKSLGTSYFTTSLGVGNFLSSLLLTTVSKLTKRGGHQGWIRDNLNTSHLDYYYGLFTVLSVINLLWFVGISSSYAYNANVIKSETLLLKQHSEHPSVNKSDGREKLIEMN